MSTSLPTMGLRVWDLSSDPYSHVDLVNNFTAINGHDHTPGRGAPIGTASLSDNAVTQAKLADNSVGTAQLIDASVTAAKLASDATLPLRAVIPWWREDTNVPVPAQYAICDGTAWSSISNDMGLSVGAIPDLRNRFVLGAATSATGTDIAHPPAIGATGGAQARDLRHLHAVNAHTHQVVIPPIGVPSHSHTVTAHAHPISTDGAHIHGYLDDLSQPQTVASRSSGSVGGTLQALYIPGFTGNFAVMNSQGGHSHTGNTGSSSASTDSIGVTVPTTTVTSNADSSTTTGNPSTDFSAVDTRPAFVGLLYIMKVRLT